MDEDDREGSVGPVTRSQRNEKKLQNLDSRQAYSQYNDKPATSTPIYSNSFPPRLSTMPVSSIKNKERIDIRHNTQMSTPELKRRTSSVGRDSNNDLSSPRLRSIINVWHKATTYTTQENAKSRELSPESMRRIRNEGIAFEANQRTNYTYASTPSYKHDGKADYESPILARKPIGYGSQYHLQSTKMVSRSLNIFGNIFSWFSNLFISTEYQDDLAKRESCIEDTSMQHTSRRTRQKHNLTLDETSGNNESVFTFIKSFLYFLFIQLPHAVFYFITSFLSVVLTTLANFLYTITSIFSKGASYMRNIFTGSKMSANENSRSHLYRRNSSKTMRMSSEERRRSICVSPFCCFLCWLPLILLLALLAGLLLRDGRSETMHNIDRYSHVAYIYMRERYTQGAVFLQTFAENSKAHLYATAVYIGGATDNIASKISNYAPDVRAWYASLPLVISLLPAPTPSTERKIDSNFVMVENGVTRDELIALQLRVTSLEKGLAAISGKSWAEIDHTHAQYVTSDELNDRLTTERINLEQLRVQIVLLQSNIETQLEDAAKSRSIVEESIGKTSNDHQNTMLKELSQIIAAMGQRVATLEKEAKVMSEALYSHGDEMKETIAKLDAAVLLFEKSKAEIDRQNVKVEEGLSKQDGESKLSIATLQQLALLPSLLSKLDQIDSDLNNRINLLIDAKQDAITGAATEAAIAATAINLEQNEKASFAAEKEVKLVAADLREQQEAFVDLRQQLVALAASLNQATANHQKMQEQYISQMSALELQMSELSADGCGKGVVGGDLKNVQKLINAALARYDADKTGMVDYALESAGGQVISTRCTVTYAQKTRRESIWGIPLFWSNYSPRSVIQRKSQSVIPGECWAFEGSVGALLIGLSGYVQVTHITYEHIPLSLAPDQNLDSAPKLMQVWGSNSENDPNTTQIAEFQFDAYNLEPMQTFAVDTVKFPAALKAFPMVELKVLSNNGHPQYTCLYRFRVHGKRVYPHYGREKHP